MDSHQQLEDIISKLSTLKDGLMPAEKLEVQQGQLYISSHPRIAVYPHWRIRRVHEMLLKDTSMWSLAAIRVVPDNPSIKSAPVFGVSFHRAIKESLRQNLVKSVFYIPKNLQDEGNYYAQLLLRVIRREDKDREIIIVEALEWIGEGIETSYAHMILDPATLKVSHIDCAIIKYASLTDINNIFSNGTKQKGICYKKYFRLDGDIPLNTSISLIHEFFSIQELVKECFEVSDHIM